MFSNILYLFKKSGRIGRIITWRYYHSTSYKQIYYKWINFTKIYKILQLTKNIAISKLFHFKSKWLNEILLTFFPFIKCNRKKITTFKKLCALTTRFHRFKKKTILLSIIMLLIAMNKNTNCMLGKINDEFSQAKIPKWGKLNEQRQPFRSFFFIINIISSLRTRKMRKKKLWSFIINGCEFFQN